MDAILTMRYEQFISQYTGSGHKVGNAGMGDIQCIGSRYFHTNVVHELIKLLASQLLTIEVQGLT